MEPVKQRLKTYRNSGCGVRDSGKTSSYFITPNHQGPAEGRPRREGICHAEGDSMAIKLIFLVMELMVFADYHPAVFACVPHACLPEDIRPLVAGNQRCESQLSLSAGASKDPTE